MAAPSFVIVAGEASGDVLAAGLIDALRGHWPNAKFTGVTGPAMRAAGCATLADIEALSLLGIAEVAAELLRLWRLRRRIYRETLFIRPAAFVGVDAPSFNIGLERMLKAAGIITVQYVCPTVWAWRQSRLPKIRRSVDLMLSIFSFEPALLGAHGVAATFVGHPLADAAPAHANAYSARRALGLVEHATWVGLLPGSRAGEVERLGPRFLAAAQWLARKRVDTRFVAPMATPGLRALFAEQHARLAPDLALTLIDGRAREVMRAADVLLCASGTATLEALLAKTPMVVAYVLSASNYWILRRFDLIKVEHVSMPNLLAGRALVDEYLQQAAQPAALGAALYRLLQSPRARAEQVDAFAAIHARLARGASVRAAAAIARLVGVRA